MSEKIYVKHKLGNFQQPYIYQQPGNSQTLSIGNTRGATTGYTQSPNTFQAQGTTIVQQPYNIQTAVQGQTRSPQTYIYQSPSRGTSIGNTRGNTQSPSTYTFQQPYSFIAQSPSRVPATYIYSQDNQGITQSPSIVQYTFQQPFRSPSRYPFEYTYPVESQVPSPSIARGTTTTRYSYQQPARGTTITSYTYRGSTTGNSDNAQNIVEKNFLQDFTSSSTTASLSKLDVVSVNGFQVRQDNLLFKHDIDTTNFSGLTVFRMYVRTATTNSPDSNQGSQAGVLSGHFETSGNPSGISSGITLIGTTYSEILRLEIPSSFTQIAGYKIELNNFSAIISSGSGSVAFGTYSSSGGSTNAYPNSTTSYYNNCLSYKVFSSQYTPSGFIIKAFGNNTTSTSMDGYVMGDVDIFLRAYSPTRTLQVTQEVEFKMRWDMNYSAPSPSPGPAPINPTVAQPPGEELN